MLRCNHGLKNPQVIYYSNIYIFHTDLHLLSVFLMCCTSLIPADISESVLSSLVHVNLWWSLFRQMKSARLNTRLQGFKKSWPGPSKWVQPWYSDPTMLILKSENSVWRRVERDSCQGMPCALKRAHNIWEIDVTWETYKSWCVCVCVSVSIHRQGDMCWFIHSKTLVG